MTSSVDLLFDRLGLGVFLQEDANPNLTIHTTLKIGDVNTQPVDWFVGTVDTTTPTASGIIAGSVGETPSEFLSYTFLADGYFEYLNIGTYTDSTSDADYLSEIYLN